MATTEDLQFYRFASGRTARVRRLPSGTVQRLGQAIKDEALSKEPYQPGYFPRPSAVFLEESIAYQIALDSWKRWAMREQFKRLLCIAAMHACTFPPDEFDQEAIDRLRLKLGADLFDVPASYTREEADKVIWLVHVCIGAHGGDGADFLAAVT